MTLSTNLDSSKKEIDNLKNMVETLKKENDQLKKKKLKEKGFCLCNWTQPRTKK